MKPLSYLTGPEAFWVLVYVGAAWFANRNVPPTEAGSQFLEKVSWLFPLVVIPLSFLVYLVPVPQRWLTARLIVSALIGVNIVVLRMVNGIDYGDSRNSGLMGV